MTAILDCEYDKLEKELAELESRTKYRINESPTRRVGYDPPEYLRILINNLVKTHFELQKEKENSFFKKPETSQLTLFG